ncbi:MAG: hypothetical protein AAGC55_08725, partial [Myxococcota bacterium]
TALLAGMFSAPELWRLIRHGVSVELADCLPAPWAAARWEYAALVAEKLLDRALLTPRLFGMWQRARPHRVREIRAFERWWRAYEAVLGAGC